MPFRHFRFPKLSTLFTEMPSIDEMPYLDSPINYADLFRASLIGGYTFPEAIFPDVEKLVEWFRSRADFDAYFRPDWIKRFSGITDHSYAGPMR